jgi:hypothetical protein
MGCGDALALGSDGHVLCTFATCPNPGAADHLLHLPYGHTVVFGRLGWTIEHPLQERLDGSLVDCSANVFVRGVVSRGPLAHGRYALHHARNAEWTMERLPAA